MNAAKLAIRLVLPDGSQARRDPDQVALGDPDVEEPVGELLAEPLGPGRVAHVGVDHDDVRMVGPEGFERTTERITGRLAQLSFRLQRGGSPAMSDHLSADQQILFPSLRLERTLLAADGDLGQGLVEVLGGHRLAVKVGVAQLAQQVEDALALVRERDDAGRLALDGAAPVRGP